MTLYETLEVTEDATATEINQAYRRLARKWHPDVNPSREAHDRMVELNFAKEVLTEPTKRAEYDNFLGTMRAESGDPSTSGKDWEASAARAAAYKQAREDADELFKMVEKAVAVGVKAAGYGARFYIQVVKQVLIALAILLVIFLISIPGIIANAQKRAEDSRSFDELANGVHGHDLGDAEDIRARNLPRRDAGHQITVLPESATDTNGGAISDEKRAYVDRMLKASHEVLVQDCGIRGNRGMAQWSFPGGRRLILRSKGTDTQDLTWELSDTHGRTVQHGNLSWYVKVNSRDFTILPQLAGLYVTSDPACVSPVFEIPEKPKLSMTLRREPRSTDESGGTLMMLKIVRNGQ